MCGKDSPARSAELSGRTYSISTLFAPLEPEEAIEGIWKPDEGHKGTSPCHDEAYLSDAQPKIIQRNTTKEATAAL